MADAIFSFFEGSKEADTYKSKLEKVEGLDMKLHNHDKIIIDNKDFVKSKKNKDFNVELNNSVEKKDRGDIGSDLVRGGNIVKPMQGEGRKRRKPQTSEIISSQVEIEVEREKPVESNDLDDLLVGGGGSNNGANAKAFNDNNDLDDFLGGGSSTNNQYNNNTNNNQNNNIQNNTNNTIDDLLDF